jgi:hypothetical protein
MILRNESKKITKKGEEPLIPSGDYKSLLNLSANINHKPKYDVC